MTDASPITGMTNLQQLHIWLGANTELPPCSNKPLRGLIAAIGKLPQLTELQLLKGLYLSWELRKIVHLDNLADLQVIRFFWGRRADLWTSCCPMLLLPVVGVMYLASSSRTVCVATVYGC
jgi:hypothetical protein